MAFGAVRDSLRGEPACRLAVLVIKHPATGAKDDHKNA